MNDQDHDRVPREGATSGRPSGYRSERDKRAFTLTAGILGAVFFLLQIIVPFVATLAAMPLIMVKSVGSMRDSHPGRAAFWKGNVWFPEKRVSVEGSDFPWDGKHEETTALAAMALGPGGEPATVLALEGAPPWLLAAEDGLWLIDAAGVSVFDGERLHAKGNVSRLGNISRPFLFQGTPALVEERPDGLRLMVFEGGDWRRERDLAGESGEACRLACMQFLVEGNSLHLFREHGNTVFFHPGMSGAANVPSGEWEPVTGPVLGWQALMADGRPTLFVLARGEGFGQVVEGYRRRQAGWERFFEKNVAVGFGFGAFTTGNGGFAIMIQSFPGSLRFLDVDGDGVVREFRHGSNFPFVPEMIAVLTVPYLLTTLTPLLLALILSALMKKHRVVEYVSENGTAPFASLARRALAQVVDAVIMGGPFMAAGWVFLGTFLDFEQFLAQGPLVVLKGLGLIGGALLWCVACMILFSVTEGVWGASPGKWFLGIRVVGTELERCGVGRAIVRNLLKFVDGFFNFLVGIMVVALSGNWQRLGDMAARTVVIDVRGRR